MNKYENIKTIEAYNSLLNSGMFWEFHPELTGDWDKDRDMVSLETPKKCDKTYLCANCKQENMFKRKPSRPISEHITGYCKHCGHVVYCS